MKKTITAKLVITLTLLFTGNSYAHAGFPVVKGSYFGQKTPGKVAEPFAPGIISQARWDGEGVFAPGMKEFYFTRMDDNYKRRTVIGFKQENNIWTKFVEFPRIGEIGFSSDGTRMFMAEGYRDRTASGWSERKSLGSMFARKDWGIMRLSTSAQGTYVFDDYKSNDVIRISRLNNGKRHAPELMDEVVNTGKWTAHPFIAPDESYLIWDSERPGGYGDTDLYIRFKGDDGSWGQAINMGKAVNTNKADYFASVTPDGKYILFNREIDDKGNTDIYWVDASIIATLKAKSKAQPTLAAHKE
ncbi:TolB family protein [Litorilituus sediminis]|uniref:WD40 repeat domain-containing protein n=1 Tax=Litorilituus sediminis TaxID=718192 RepID=A0A4P6P4Z3_9GAMM|nr:PD40 domain-containing protein [Litorilituus sediminis]QBG36484.1 hypothetical protein EMK97_12525 [Litorilituus sediminis]